MVSPLSGPYQAPRGRNGLIRLKDDRQREQNGALQTARSVNYFVNQFTLDCWIMSEPVDQQEEKKAPKRASFWPPLLFIGGLFLGGYFLSEIDKESPGSASVIVRWIIGLGIV